MLILGVTSWLLENLRNTVIFVAVLHGAVSILCSTTSTLVFL